MYLGNNVRKRSMTTVATEKTLWKSSAVIRTFLYVKKNKRGATVGCDRRETSLEKKRTRKANIEENDKLQSNGKPPGSPNPDKRYFQSTCEVIELYTCIKTRNQEKKNVH